MTIEISSQSRKIEEEKRRGYLLFKVDGAKDHLVCPWPKDWKIPRNAIVGLGIPTNEEQSLVIAFSPSRGLPSHAFLDATIHHICPDCCYFSASLRSYRGHSILTLSTLTEEDRKKAEEAGVIYQNPDQVLTDADLKVIAEALGACEYTFALESRHIRAMHEPLGGIDYLRRKLQTTSGD
ncbi:MAG: hypothetical protein M1575_02220 [Patescibacteria group bacterium]|nr:hypothetical protein [Patescibacteria group bacterium]MCL5095518.1 hypothetical protein [Patescibacteria group bacterium]